MRCRQVQDGKRDGGLYRLLVWELFRDARGERFRNVSQLSGGLELSCEQFRDHSVYLQRRSERAERGPVRSVRNRQVQDGHRHGGVYKL